jgi:hypothetical protein
VYPFVDKITIAGVADILQVATAPVGNKTITKIPGTDDSKMGGRVLTKANGYGMASVCSLILVAFFLRSCIVHKSKLF